MPSNTTQAKILTPADLETLHYPLPAIWLRVAGMLKGKKSIDPVRYQRQIRAEWEKRLRRQYRLARSPRHDH